MKRIFLASAAHLTIASIAAQMQERSMLYITTASEVSPNKQFVERNRAAITRAGFSITEYTITGKFKDEIRNALSKTAIIFIEGGNTLHLLSQMQATDSLSIFRESIETGTVYIGSSAGSIVCSPSIALTADPEQIALSPVSNYTGLGVVDFYTFVHVQREKYAQRFIAYAQRYNDMRGEKVIPLQDNQYVCVRGDMYKIITVSEDR